MITKPIGFTQIAVNADYIFGLTDDGDVYYREVPPRSYSTTTYQGGYGGSAGAQKKDEQEEKRAWKKCFMEYKVELPKGGTEREAQSATDTEQAPPTAPVEVVVDEPARKVYKDADTIKAVQTALKERGLYKDTWKIDGEAGKLTQDAIKAFQKTVNLRETGEIDLTLWNALGLNKNADNEVTIEVEAVDEVSDDQIEKVEDYNEGFIGA